MMSEINGLSEGIEIIMESSDRTDGIIGFIVLIFSAAVILAFGWLYGIYMLIRDILAIT